MASVQGFLDGYQTMDTLAALNFGIIVAMNIQARGIKKEKSVMNETIWAGWIAGIVL
ncbi:MAG TPA: branched-chain amino acid transport system II carrier protein, partial [Lachnospiraceae bacterium]|nr:branched-chain amino acid transport system II carrier protein [Lachnospiraceae bacterium]